MTIHKFEDIISWQKARILNKELLNLFRDSRDYTFKDQLLRASLSITNNIAEGFERGTNKELKYFLTIARGSNAEVRSMLYIALDSDYITQIEHSELLLQTEEVGRLLTGFIKKLTNVQK